MNAPLVSVVIATHDRPELLRRLVAQLAGQVMTANAFEVIVVDDGSAVEATTQLEGVTQPMQTRVVRREQGGPGAARHSGALLARGHILVFVDDDMRLPSDFLHAHLAAHLKRSESLVVLGNIQPSEQLAQLPLFERYHARQLARWQDAATAGTTALRGVHLCTGNVSMRREDYLAVGGFDPSLLRSEDRELGVRLEQHGCQFVFGARAVSYHDSDHTDIGRWLRRAWLYGMYDLKIARRHPSVDNTHPWRFWQLVHPVSRPVLATAIAVPFLGRIMARASYRTAQLLDWCGATRLAVTLTALSYGIEYFRGMREECGSLAAMRAEIASGGGTPEAPRVVPPSSWKALRRAIRADHDATRRQRMKYHGESIAPARIWVDLVRKIGFQMLAWVRLMRFFQARGTPILPMVISRLLRHLYGAEIHWEADIAPGISIVHGNGLVLSHAATVGEGCILFQNVTLGENRDPESGAVGAPTLGRNVHVGPGATLLGPITIGEGSKIMAGVVLTRSVPPGSLVGAPEPVVRVRKAAPAALSLSA